MTQTMRLGVTHAAMLVSACILFAASPASAQELFTRNRASGSFTAGYGFAVQGTSPRNPYDASLGASVGYTLDFGLYLGAMADYFLGDSEFVFGTRNDTLEHSYDWSHMAAEVGFDIAAKALVLRPAIAVGAAIYGSCLNDRCESATYMLVAPGITVLAPLGKHSFFSFALRYLFKPKSDNVDPHDGMTFALGLGAAL